MRVILRSGSLKKAVHGVGIVHSRWPGIRQLISVTRRSSRKRRLWDGYRFPGFGPEPTVRGIFGDRKRGCGSAAHCWSFGSCTAPRPFAARPLTMSAMAIGICGAATRSGALRPCSAVPSCPATAVVCTDLRAVMSCASSMDVSEMQVNSMQPPISNTCDGDRGDRIGDDVAS